MRIMNDKWWGTSRHNTLPDESYLIVFHYRFFGNHSRKVSSVLSYFLVPIVIGPYLLPLVLDINIYSLSVFDVFVTERNRLCMYELLKYLHSKIMSSKGFFVNMVFSLFIFLLERRQYRLMKIYLCTNKEHILHTRELIRWSFR